MKLGDFLRALDGAGLDLGVEDLLDAFWLARHAEAIRLHDRRPAAGSGENAAEQHRAAGAEPAAAPESAPATATPKPAAPAPTPQPEPVYPAGRVAATQPTRPAAPVPVPAGHGLSGRLPLARALRPFRRPWRSGGVMALDEAGTVEASAEAHGALCPVFRPAAERWFEVHLVLKDDPAIALWQDALRDFRRLLEETGAFRAVRVWRVRWLPKPGPAAPEARLESPAGARVHPRYLAGGAARRLILFASHGESPAWLDGRHAQLLRPWTRVAGVAILHLFERHLWARGAPGSAAGLADRAAMQMGRGRACPVSLLDPEPPPPPPDPWPPTDYARAVALLRESSPAAFRLAVALGSGAFTIPVARIVQEVQFRDQAHPSHLAEVLLSGLVRPRAPEREDADPLGQLLRFSRRGPRRAAAGAAPGRRHRHR